MIEISCHIASESSINDFPPVHIPPVQPKHITPEVKNGLSHICCRLAHYLTNVLYHCREFGIVLFRKQTQFVDRTGANKHSGLIYYVLFGFELSPPL